VSATPTVASTTAGAIASRTRLAGVFKPPSKRMKTRASVPRLSTCYRIFASQVSITGGVLGADAGSDHLFTLTFPALRPSLFHRFRQPPSSLRGKGVAGPIRGSRSGIRITGLVGFRLFEAPDRESVSSNAAIARSSRSFSLFKSTTIFWMSNVSSFVPLDNRISLAVQSPKNIPSLNSKIK
jgi:hypothetical protein